MMYSNNASASAQNDFHQDMLNLYRKVKAIRGTCAKYILADISNYGGLYAAKKAITGNMKTFTALWENKRLDLSVEALILQPKYCSLFSDEELNICRNRLADCGFTF